MRELSQSPFLQALGYAIANSFWQVALLWVIVIALNAFFNFSSHNRYRIALTAQLGGFTWFLVTLQFYYFTCSEALASAEALDLGSGNSYIIDEQYENLWSLLLSLFIKAERILPYLAVAYLGLLAFLSLRWFRGYHYTQEIKNKGLQKIDVEWRLFVKKMSAQLNIKQDIKISLSNLISSPLTIGYLKPVILIPIASINNLTVEQLEAVIFHELAHIKRADYFINLLQTVIETALFFNPFTQLLSKVIQKERENSCDDWVLQFQYNATMYAEALLRIAYQQTQSAFAMNVSGKKGGDLLSRVRRLLNEKENNYRYRHQLIAFVLMTGILSSVAWFQPAGKIKHIALVKKENLQPVVIEPLSAKIENPFFNPVFFLSKPLKEEVSKVLETTVEKLKDKTPVINNEVSPVVISQKRKVKLNLKVQEDHLIRLKQNEQNLERTSLNNQLLIFNSLETKLTLLQARQHKAKEEWKKIKEGLAKAKEEVVKQLMNNQWKHWDEKELAATIEKAMEEIPLADFVSTYSPSFTVLTPDKFSIRKERKEEVNLRQPEFHKPLEKLRRKEDPARLPRRKSEHFENEIHEPEAAFGYNYSRPVYREVHEPDFTNINTANSLFSSTIDEIKEERKVLVAKSKECCIRSKEQGKVIQIMTNSEAEGENVSIINITIENR